MRVCLLAGKDRKQKRQIGVIRVQQIQLAKVQRIVAGQGGEIGVQLVVGFYKQIAVRVGEDASKFRYELIEFRSCPVIQDNREREIPERFTVTQGAQAIPKILNVSLFGLVHQHIARVRLGGVVAHLRDESRL